jgi:glucose/mannose-6-phosphate isomerase
MKTLIDALPQHILAAVDIYNNTTLKPAERNINSLVITGLGGSGIGASILAEMLKNDLQIPVIINKDYQLPGFVNENTLMIACSYSGNTEETIAATHEALERGCMLVAISSGGSLIELAKKHEFNHLVVPGGNPPRSMLGYSLVLLFALMEHYNLAHTDVKTWSKRLRDFLTKEHNACEKEAGRIAEHVKGKIGVVYACQGMGAIAERVRQQLNENSKMVGWNGTIPEMNHNELVGWHFDHPEIAVLILRSSFEHPRNAMRAELNKDILLKKTPNVIEIHGRGETPIEAAFHIIHITDLLSHHLAEAHGVDIFDIDVIDYLKGELAKR